MSTRFLLAVLGDAQLREDDPRYAMARELGRLAVDAGFRVVTGGLGGVMEAACRGARESARYREGDTVGLLPGFDPTDANPWVDIPIATGLDHLRNALVANADVVVAIGGGAGTLSEMCFAWMRRRPIVALAAEGWSGELGGRALDARARGGDHAYDSVRAASSPGEAVRFAVEAVSAPAKRHRGM